MVGCILLTEVTAVPVGSVFCFLSLFGVFRAILKLAEPIPPLAIDNQYPLNTVCITKTRLYYFNPLKPHFYIVKLGFIGVYIIFLISAQKHRLLVLVRTASARRF